MLRLELVNSLDVRLRLYARIIEVWAGPWRSLEPGPAPLTAAEIAELVTASPGAVRRVLASKKFPGKLERVDGKPTKWALVLETVPHGADLETFEQAER